jgi:hypothetical protein
MSLSTLLRCHGAVHRRGTERRCRVGLIERYQSGDFKPRGLSGVPGDASGRVDVPTPPVWSVAPAPGVAEREPVIGAEAGAERCAPLFDPAFPPWRPIPEPPAAPCPCTAPARVRASARTASSRATIEPPLSNCLDCARLAPTGRFRARLPAEAALHQFDIAADMKTNGIGRRDGILWKQRESCASSMTGIIQSEIRR